MINPFKTDKYSLEEVHQYVEDLKEITKLRDLALSHHRIAEAKNYDNIIDGMQRVLIFLTDK